MKISPILGQNKYVIFTIASIAILSFVFGIFLYNYYGYFSSNVISLSASDTVSNSEIEAHGISRLLTETINSVMINIQLLANAPSIQSDLPYGIKLIDLAQQTTKNVTNFYMWLNQDGKIVWISNINQSQYDKYNGFDLSYRDYFKIPKDSLLPFFSRAVDSNDNITRLYISYPIVKNETESDYTTFLNSSLFSSMDITNNYDVNINSTDENGFEGVITAAIRIDVIGEILQDMIPSKYNGTVGLVDPEGTILYTSNKTLVGSNVNEDRFQSLLPVDFKNSFNSFLNKSLNTKTVGTQDIKYGGNITTFAYAPISFGNYHIGTLYISAPHILTQNVKTILDQQQLFVAVVYLLIAIITIAISFVILSWNKRLRLLVGRKTMELKKTNRDLQLANENLRQHDRIQRDFINVAAHELRTPIQAILGYVELLQNSLGLIGDRDKQFVNEIYPLVHPIARNASRLQQLIADILDIAKIDSGNFNLNKEKVNLDEKIEIAIKDTIAGNGFIKEKNLQFFLNNKKIEETVNLKHNDPVFVDVDRTRIYRALSNLLSNAAKFSNDRERIDITLDKFHDSDILGEDKDVAVVKVIDRGRGIDSEIKSKLFNKFVTKSEKGTGLGLYITKKIIEAHGGKIWGENNYDGTGATFTFVLPLYKTP
ncbi:MAG: sensor histidine kinase [Thermoproteota archaeon]|nr:sensor histidine kinase [Thermoproteota archaeon]